MSATHALYRYLQHHHPDALDIDCHAHVRQTKGTWRMSYWVQLPDTIDAENTVHALDSHASILRQNDAFLIHGDMPLSPSLHQKFCVESSSFPSSPLETTTFNTALNQAPNLRVWWNTVIDDAGQRYAAIRDWVGPSPAQQIHIDTMTQAAKDLIPRLIQHTHIQPILEEQPSSHTNKTLRQMRQRGLYPTEHHLVGVEFKAAYLTQLPITSACAPLLRVSPVLDIPGVSRLQSVDFKDHTQGMIQTIEAIGNILGVNTASSMELKQWLRGDGISMVPPEIVLSTDLVMASA